ncbi:hypothetical protein TNCV_4861681 [Trichonephila clavipes]|nr:hypothetical protein TNCV_4861681 [Trichonephila clavipes]
MGKGDATPAPIPKSAATMGVTHLKREPKPNRYFKNLKCAAESHDMDAAIFCILKTHQLEPGPNPQAWAYKAKAKPAALPNW